MTDAQEPKVEQGEHGDHEEVLADTLEAPETRMRTHSAAGMSINSTRPHSIAASSAIAAGRARSATVSSSINQLGFASTYHPENPRRYKPLAIPSPLTLKQKLYLVLSQTIGAACIDGGANFGVAYAMYHNQDQVRFWPLNQNTIAGDLGVTIIVQGIATYMITSGLVHADLRNKMIDPFPSPWPAVDWTKPGGLRIDEEEHKEAPPRDLLTAAHNDHGIGRGLHFFSGSEVQDLFNFRIGSRALGRRWLASLYRAGVMCAIYFFLIWPIAILILAPIYTHRNMAHSYTPMIIKLVYGFIYGLLQNPVVAMIALGSEDAILLHQSEEQEKRREEQFAQEALANGHVDQHLEGGRLEGQTQPMSTAGATSADAGDFTTPTAEITEPMDNAKKEEKEAEAKSATSTK